MNVEHQEWGRGGKVLVVDHDRFSRTTVARTLRDAGYTICEAVDGEAAKRALDEFRPELVVLEAALPDVDGFELARHVADRRPGTHVIFLTSRDSTADKVTGLEVAADYMTKPFSDREVAARVRAVMRRARPDDVLEVGDITLDAATHEVERAGEPVELTPREFDLLRIFMLNPGRVLSKARLLEEVWEDPFGVHPSVVETYVGYLRRKLDGPGPSPIQTVHRVGYVLR
jgi:two-component system OmpR family response regulator